MPANYTDDSARIDLRLAEGEDPGAAWRALERAARAPDPALRLTALQRACQVAETMPRLESGIRVLAFLGLLLSLCLGVWLLVDVGGPWGIAYCAALSAQGVIWYVLLSAFARALELLARIDVHVRAAAGVGNAVGTGSKGQSRT